MNAKFNDIIDMVWDIKVKGLDMMQLIVFYPNHIKERNLAEMTKSWAVSGKNFIPHFLKSGNLESLFRSVHDIRLT